MIKGLYEAHLPISNMDQSIEFYHRLGLTLAQRGERVSFMWVDKGRSWIGLWKCDQVNIPYHPSIRHIAFHVDIRDMEHVQQWLKERNISVREDFGIAPDRQPLVLSNPPHAHAAIYFNDPDGNSIELIAPLELDPTTPLPETEMELAQWYNQQGKRTHSS